MKVHFKGWKSKFDEVIQIDNSLIGEKYAEIGLFSKAFGYAKFH